MSSREELNKQAGEILARAQQLASLRGGTNSCQSRETSSVVDEENAIAHLSTECKRLRADIEQMKRECSEFPPLMPPPENGSRDETLSLLVEEVRLRSELTVLNQAKKTNTGKSPVWQGSVLQQVRESLVEQNHLLIYLRDQRERVENKLKKQKTLLSETKQLETALEKRWTDVTQDTSPNTSSERELRERIAVVEETIKSLRENLVQFCEDEIVQYSDEVEGERRKTKKRKGDQEKLDTMLTRGTSNDKARRDRSGGNEFPSLSHVIQELISKTLSSPHSPYHSLSSIWPPHGTLLLRSGVIQRHPDNPSLVRVTPFHL